MAVSSLRCAWVAVLLLAGCSQPEEPPPPRPAPRGSWEWERIESGAILLLRGADGREIMRLTCWREPARTRVDIAVLEAMAAQQVLSLDVDGLPFVFSAGAADGRPGVHGESATPTDFFDSLQRANTVGAVYGSRYLGPFAPPGPQRVAEFTQECRPVPVEAEAPAPVEPAP